MSACGCEAPSDEELAEELEESGPWWRDLEVMIPVASGVFLVAGLFTEWLGSGRAADVVALVFFWTALVLGASTFVPGALRRLIGQRKLGIGLLMTISAAGAVILGYVEEAAALAFLYSIVEALEDKAMDRARGGLRSLLSLAPERASVVRFGQTIEVAAKDVVVGDVVRVRPGERIATDGRVLSGHSSVDASAITGESILVAVEPGSEVPAGAVNAAGALEVEASVPGSDNSLTTIVKLIEQAQHRKGERARIADRIARPLVPGVIVLAIAVAVIGSLLGDPQLWVTRALVVLVAASPCAMAISVPVTVVSAIGAASKFGVVIKSGAAFEDLGTIKHVAVDKTGTLTSNKPTVTAVEVIEGANEAEVLALAGALEAHSTHPLATAIVAAAEGMGELAESSDVVEEAGRGISGMVNGRAVAVRSPRFGGGEVPGEMAGELPGELADDVDALEADGQTCVVVSVDGTAVGVIGVRDELRPEAAEAVQALRDRGVSVSMLTGDNERTARALAEQAGIDDVAAQLRPEDKAKAVASRSTTTPTAMIGDGINDAPALASATVGIAMGVSGSDAAIESADVAFTGSDLRLIPQALGHARRSVRIINQNIVLSLAIITVLMPLAITGVLGLAAVVLIRAFLGFTLHVEVEGHWPWQPPHPAQRRRNHLDNGYDEEQGNRPGD